MFSALAALLITAIILLQKLVMWFLCCEAETAAEE